MPELRGPPQADTSNEDALDGLAKKLRGPQENPNADVLARVEAILRGMPDLPTPAAGQADGSGGAGPRRPAMTPMEGPDTGEENPNADYGKGAPKGYFSALRGPEGTKDNPNAVNPVTGAGGPYQFLPSTWASIMKNAPELGLTEEGFRNPSKFMPQHDAAIRYYTDDSIRSATRLLGRQPTPGELYSMHLLGQGGGAKLLSNPDAPLSSLVAPIVISSNPWMKKFADRPARDILKHFEGMMS